MKISLMTGYYYDEFLLKRISVINNLGFKNIEIWAEREHFPYYYNRYNADLFFSERCGYLLKKIRKMEMTIEGFHIPLHGKFDILNKNNRKFVIRCGHFLIDLLLPEKRLIIHPGSDRTEDPEANFENSTYILGKLADYAAGKGVYICLENPLPHHFGGRLKELKRILKFLKKSHKNIGICLDTSHANLSEGVVPFIRNFKKDIIWTHISDNNGKYDEHLIPGKGNINWKKVVSGLKKKTDLEYLNLEILRPKHKSGLLVRAREYLESIL